MPATTVRLRSTGGDPAADSPDDALRAALAALPERLGLATGYPADAVADAERAAATTPLPEDDATDLDLVTVDPPGSKDLDQALGIERAGSGWIVHYAIADVDGFIAPGGALDAEVRRRGQTLYAPDRRIPLHPDVLGEGAASLLAGQVRPAALWTLTLDGEGALIRTGLRRARVRSRARLDYAGVQASVDAGTAEGSLALLREVGEARQHQELLRGGASLPTPEVDVEPDGAGYRLVRRRPLPVEGWNAQLSLLTGMAAARLMLDGGAGILRTMPPAGAEDVARFRRQAAALGLPWGETQPYGAYLAALDLDDPRALAVLHAAAALFRGAAYTVVEAPVPEGSADAPVQAALGAPYAHVTAPIRRLVDRFGLRVCLALAAGRAIDDATRADLTTLPAIMAASGQLAGRLDRAAVDTVEAGLLAGRVGEVFDADVIAAKPADGHGGPHGGGSGGGTIQLADPAVTAPCSGDLEAGTRIRARLESADIATAEVRFSRAS